MSMSGYPLARLKYSPASCPTVGQAAALGCAQLCRRCLATPEGHPQTPVGPQGLGVHGGEHPSSLPAQPWCTVHMCMPTYATCARAVFVRDTSVHVCSKCLCFVPSDPPASASNMLAPISLCWPGAWQHPWV